MIHGFGGNSRLSVREVGDRPEMDAHDRTVVKVIDVVGSSGVSFGEAANNAVRATAMSIRSIQGVEVLSSSADVPPSRGMALYKLVCRIAFVVEGPRASTTGG